MATIHNSDLTKEVIDGAKIQTAFDKVPSAIADKVVPVMEVNPKLLRVTNIVGAENSDATGILYPLTVSATKKSFITGFTASYEKDANCDETFMAVSIQLPNEEYVSLFEFATITLTASGGNITVTFPPLEVLKGSSVTFSGAFTAGVLLKSASAWGYEIEDI